MNYRHAYHAGNFADVFKHAVLVALIESLKLKPKPLCYFDTHAGAGRYDLHGGEAQKTGEFREGVLRLLSQPRLPAPLQPYAELIRAWNPRAQLLPMGAEMPVAAGVDAPASPAFTQTHAEDAARPAQAMDVYPGSPLIAARLLRPEDRLILCELQDAECAELRAEFARDPRVGVHQRDGYAALKAMLPPKERRGLVLIDPPFEAQEQEFAAIEDALEGAFTRFATGVYAIWYPIKLRSHVAPFHRWLRRCGQKKILVAEILLHPDDSILRLNGCGLAIINTPWQLDEHLNELLPLLLRQLAQGRFGAQHIEWLA